MAIQLLYRRWTSTPFASVEAEDRGRALETAARSEADLTYADLRRLDAPSLFLPGVALRGADLTSATLAGAYLRKADLRAAILAESNLATASVREADLRNADLRNADLRRADLRNARFVGSDLRGAILTGARLEGALIDWRWSAFPVELLRRDAPRQCNAFRVVAKLALEDDDRPFGWLRILVRETDVIDWAVGVLFRASLAGDNTPELLRRLANDAPVDSSSTPSQRLWTRRASPA
jgi:Pentapeptide repeats (8 copies)